MFIDKIKIKYDVYEFSKYRDPHVSYVYYVPAVNLLAWSLIIRFLSVLLEIYIM